MSFLPTVRIRPAAADGPMLRGARAVVAVLLTASAVLSLAGPVAGQALASADAPARVGADPNALEARARNLIDSPSRYREAAALYLKAADLRGAADAKAVENRRLAANLYFYNGDEARAQAVMEAAAEAALAIGDVAAAAQRFLDAASVARQRGIGDSVVRLVERARLLMESPLLDDEVRSGVLRRLDDSGVAEVRHRRVRLATGVELAVAETGAADGEPVLFLHGYTDSWFSFSLALDRLPANIRAIAPTQRGHGESDRPDCCYRMEDLAADAVALLDALGIQRATVVGHSMGSFVAMRVAADYPERVTRLVLAATSRTIANDVVSAFSKDVAALTDPIDPEFTRAFQASTALQPLPPGFLEAVSAESRKLPARAWRALMAGMLAEDGAVDRRRIGAPTLIIGGDSDAIFPLAMQQALTHEIPAARFVTYEQTGHAPHWERPDRFVADLLAFVNGNGT